MKEYIGIPKVHLPFLLRDKMCFVEKNELMEFIKKVSRGGAYNLPDCIESIDILQDYLEGNPTLALEIRDHFQPEYAISDNVMKVS